MGIDKSWTSLPVDSSLYGRGREGEFGEDFEYLSLRYRVPAPWGDEFSELAAEIARHRPGITSRCLANPSRTYDALEYLLSESRRTGVPEPPSIWSMIFHGDAILHESAVTSIGSTIRLLDPLQVRKVASSLMTINEDALLSNYDPVAMERVGVYKLRDDPAIVVSDFHLLCDMFWKVADVGDEVILVALS